MPFENEIGRLQQILREIMKAIKRVTALIEIPDTWIDNAIEGTIPAEIPTTSATIAAAEAAEAAQYAALLQSTQAELRTYTEDWLRWIETETQRVLTTAAETPVIVSPRHRIVQRVTITKPPPTLPATLYDELLSIANILYYVIIAALSGEVYMRATDIDRLIDDFIKIVEVISRVGRGG